MDVRTSSTYWIQRFANLCPDARTSLEIEGACINSEYSRGTATTRRLWEGNHIEPRSLIFAEGGLMKEGKDETQSSDTALQKAVAISRNFMAGTFAGVMECIVGHPLDTLKVRMQTAQGSNLAGLGATLASTIKNEGVLALYRGASSRIVGSALCCSVLFGTNGEFKRLVGADSSAPLSPLFLTAAGMTGAVEAIVYTPVDLVKTKCQVQYGRHVELTPWKAAQQLVHTHGVYRGLFAGIWPTLVREIIGNMAYFGVYELTKRRLMAWRGQQEGDAATYILAGGTAGLAYWTLIFPVDSVKSIVQAHPPGTKALPIAAQIWRKDGLAGFYRGLSPALLRAFPACAATFASFEYALRLLTPRTTT